MNHVTRSRPGARRASVALAVVALALAGPRGAPAAPPEEELGPLPWRAGGRVGFTVDAASFPDSGGHVLEVYVRVPPSTVRTLVRGPEGHGSLRLSARLQDAFGGAKRTAGEEFSIDPGDTTRGFGRVVLLRFAARPGPQRLQVKLEDLHSQKRGLAYLGRKVRESATLEGEFDLPGPQANREISDIEFVWSEDSLGVPVGFRRGGRPRLPNPERLYGLFARDLRAFFEASGPPGDQRPWQWVARVLDTKGQVVLEQRADAPAGRWVTAGARFDLSKAAAGGYDLEIKAWQEGDSGAVVRRSRFSVAWQPDSWLLDPERAADMVHLLLPASQEESFARLQPGEQEAVMESFWSSRDPDPDTPRNEARDEFLERVAIANQRYSRPEFEGVLSDMGRVFARYGEPSEILRQVVPAGDNTLLEAIRELSLSEDRPIGEVHQKGPGGDMRPFEVWIYEGNIPLPPDADPALGHTSRRQRLVFLFVDQLGTGDYVLRYTTE